MARRDPNVADHFICFSCEESKPRSGYYRGSRDGISAYCMSCTRSKTKAWARTPQGAELKIASHLKRAYGISIGEFETLFSFQDGKCAICQLELVRGKETHVDHDHYSGQVRGLLCHHCNLMLGHAKDNPERLRSAADYLEKYSAL